MKERITTLEEISSNVIKRVRGMEICMPSDYLSEFNLELKSAGKESVNEAVNEAVAEDLKKAKYILNKTQELVSSSVEKIENAVNSEEVDIIHFVKYEMKELLNQIKSLSNEVHTDELTGANNRRWIFKEFLSEDKTFKSEGVIAFIDLNKFKDINDNYGHVTGDKTLIYLVKFLTSELKKLGVSFTIVRFAGDEFIILFDKKHNEKEIKIILGRIHTRLQKLNLKPTGSDNNNFFRISFSYGVSKFRPGDKFSDILDEVDTKMYRMKEDSRIREEDKK